MLLSTLKKQKVDSENRQFNSEWTQKYLFVFASGKPVCLLCSECISVSKEYNLRRHFKTNHANFDATFPLGSDARRKKILGLTSCYEQRRQTLFRACSDQERAASASQRVAWILGKIKGRLQTLRLSKSVCLNQSRRCLQMRKPETE